jgi:hypothetical protein
MQRQPIGLAATSPQALMSMAQAHEDMAFAAHLEDSELPELTYPDLLKLADEVSETDDWLYAGEIRAELKAREAEAIVALRKLFRDAVNIAGTVLVYTGGAIKADAVADYLKDVLDTRAGTEFAVDMVLRPADRLAVIEALARNYADNEWSDLLRAGWLPGESQ